MIIEPTPTSDEPQQPFDPPGYVVEIMNGQDIFVGEEIVLLQLENGNNKINNLSNNATNFSDIINNLDLSGCFDIGNTTNGTVLDLVSKLNINNGINISDNSNNVENTTNNNSNMNLRKRKQHQINVSPRKKRPQQVIEDINIVSNAGDTMNLIYPIYNTNHKNNNIVTTNVSNHNILNNNPTNILNFSTMTSTMNHGVLKTSTTCNNTGKTQFVCPECSKTFETDKYLSMHLSLHKYPDHRLPSSSPTTNLNSKVKKLFVATDKESVSSAETLSNILKFSSTSNLSTKVTTATSLLNTIQQQQHQPHQQQNIQQLQQQMQQPNGQWTCPYCQKTFVQNSNFKNHVRTHSDERPFVCDICSIGFKERYHLKKHVLFKHTDDLKETCRICGKCFKDSTAVRAHERIHSEARPYGCGLCGKTFKTSECLWHHENRSKTCGKAIIAKKMQQIQQQQQPVLGQTGNVSRFTLVTGVGNNVNIDATKSLLQQQLPQMPQPRRQKRSKLAESLQSSMKTNTFQLEQSHIQQQHMTKLILDNNQKVNNKAIQNSAINDLDILSEFWLEIDERSINNINNINSINNNSNINNCNNHNSSPDNLTNLNLASYNDNSTQHMYTSSTTSVASPTTNTSTISSESRPYVCRICDSAFKLKVHLKKHHLYRHTDEYPCECSICGKRFKDTSAVRLHERIHSDDRPFRCECGKNFKTNENLWGHKNRGPCEWKITNGSTSTTAVAATNVAISAENDVTNTSVEMDDNKGEVPIILSKPIFGIIKVDDEENKKEQNELEQKLNIKRILPSGKNATVSINNNCGNVDDIGNNVDDKSNILATPVIDSKIQTSKSKPNLISSIEQSEDVFVANENGSGNSVNDHSNIASCVVVGNNNNIYNNNNNNINNNFNIPTAIVTPIQRLKINTVNASNITSNNNNNNSNNGNSNKTINVRNVININPISDGINNGTELNHGVINNNFHSNNNNNNINNNKLPLLLKLSGNTKETMTLLIPANKKITNNTNAMSNNCNVTNNNNNNNINNNNTIINNNNNIAINRSNINNNGTSSIKGNKILKTLIVNKNNMALINNLIMAKNNSNNNINNNNNNNNNNDNNNINVNNNNKVNSITSTSNISNNNDNNNAGNNINSIGVSIKSKLMTLTKNYNNKNNNNSDNLFGNINSTNDNNYNADLVNMAIEDNDHDNDDDIDCNTNNNINTLMYNKINNINNGNASFVSDMTESTDDASESLSLEDDDDDDNEDDDIMFSSNNINNIGNKNNNFFSTFNNILNTDRYNLTSAITTSATTSNNIYNKEQRLNNIIINNNNINNNNINSLNVFDEIDQTLDIQIDDIYPSWNENEMMVNLMNTPCDTWTFEDNSLFSLID